MSVPSAEAAILHACLDDDRDEAVRRIADLLPGERHNLRSACYWLISLIDDEQQRAASHGEE